MPRKIKVTRPASLTGSGKLAEVEKNKESILLEGGKALQELLADWMDNLNSARSKHGSNFYNADDVQSPVVDGDTVAVAITTPGISRAFHDIIIRPKEAQTLAIPLHADASGISPREYNNIHPKGTPEALFRPKGKDYLAKNDNGSLVVMYLLRKSVHQPQDRSLLPSDDEMDTAVMDAIHGAIEAILQ